MVASNNAIYNTVGASISGVTNTLTLTNPSNTASSAARETVVVGGGTAGDPTINWNVSGVTNWEMGIDNSVSDNLTISQGTALGTNDVWRMTVAGERTMPLQPAFSATLAADVLNITGDGTPAYPIICGNEVFDQNSDYNNATGFFTAPVTGNYFFCCNIVMRNLSAAQTEYRMYFISTNEISEFSNGNSGTMRGLGNTIVTMNGSTFINMTAGNTIAIGATVSGGTKTVFLGGSAFLTTSPYCYFKGYLVC